MKIWQVTWSTYSESSDSSDAEWVLFETEDAARASCPTDGSVEEVEVRAEPLATQVRYEVRSNLHYRDKDVVPEIYKPRKFIVNEMQEGFGEPLTNESGWWLDGPTVTSADRKEALAYVHAKVDPEIKREQERLAYIATFTHQYRCPDHGDLSMYAPDSRVGCRQCRRWVDPQGRRFGHYQPSITTNNGDGTFTISTLTSFGSAQGTDVDEGPWLG